MFSYHQDLLNYNIPIFHQIDDTFIYIQFQIHLVINDQANNFFELCDNWIKLSSYKYYQLQLVRSYLRASLCIRVRSVISSSLESLIIKVS
ncbi:unnamed protein product [Rhizophagus irregularis]|nr:unnamed protein product [Rhizophagus irregularis]